MHLTGEETQIENGVTFWPTLYMCRWTEPSIWTDLRSQMTWSAVRSLTHVPPADVALSLCCQASTCRTFAELSILPNTEPDWLSNCCTESLQSERHPDLSAARSSSSSGSISICTGATDARCLQTVGDCGVLGRR